MNTIKVVRITKDGLGIFSPKVVDSFREDYRYVNLNKRHQNFNTPQEDFLDIRKEGFEWFCTYKSVGQLQQWNTFDEINMLIEKGFSVLMLEVSEYQIGEHQIIFTKESIVKTVDISNYFKRY